MSFKMRAVLSSARSASVTPAATSISFHSGDSDDRWNEPCGPRATCVPSFALVGSPTDMRDFFLCRFLWALPAFALPPSKPSTWRNQPVTV